MIGNIPSLRRQLKNVAYNYSDPQVKVREATSNDPWGPSSSLMSEIADMTYNAMAFTEIMQMIWKRLNDHGKNWRHVYKALVLLDYLIKTGSEKVAQQCKENIYAIQTLKDFQHIEDNKDQGINVREKAKQMVALLKDDERLRNERAKALMAKKRFAQNGAGIGPDGVTHRSGSDAYRGDEDYASAEPTQHTERSSHRIRADSELEEARPATVGEEELQLQIALALSREEAEKEADLRRGDDVRLQLALQESKKEDEEEPPKYSGVERNGNHQFGKSQSAIDDLLSLGGAFGGAPAPPPAAPAPHMGMDPWGAPAPAPAPMPVPAATAFDPWGAPAPSKPMDPWAPAPSNDPWGGEPVTATSPMTGIDPDEEMMGAVGGAPKRNLKTPETFLGENSALVNLDNLMGPSRVAVPGMPPKAAASNPFASGSGAAVAATNPFAAQRRPSPTLNEMRAQSTTTTTTTGWNTSGGNVAAGGQWNLPQPIQPQRPASTNPFL